MAPVHEIGFLVLGGLLQCWFYPPSPEIPCREGDKLKPAVYATPDDKSTPAATISRTEAQSQYEIAEVNAEESGFAVFEQKPGGWYLIRRKDGKSVWLKKPSQGEWNFKPLEKILGEGMLNAAEGFEKELRKEDLQTPLPLPSELRERVRRRGLSLILQHAKAEVPIGFIEVKTPCTYREIAPGHRQGSCAAPPGIAVYADAAKTSTKVADATLTWAHLSGRIMESQNPHIERLYYYAQKGEWLKVQLQFGPENKRTAWLLKTELPSNQITFGRFAANEDFKAAFAALQAKGDPYGNSYDAATDLPSIRPTGKTKWAANGILWVEVELQDLQECSPEESHALMKAWLPYRKPQQKEPVITWFSRGC